MPRLYLFPYSSVFTNFIFDEQPRSYGSKQKHYIWVVYINGKVTLYIHLTPSSAPIQHVFLGTAEREVNTFYQNTNPNLQNLMDTTKTQNA